MESWFEEIVLETERIKLVPLCLDYKEDLLNAAKDGDLGKLWFTSVPTVDTIDDYMDKAINDFKLNKGLAFAVIDKKSDKIIGTSRYTNATPEYKRLEIGYTWYAKSYQKSFVNTECKLLLLTYAFEVLETIAVELRTNWYNFESRKAIAKLGAKQDGVLRNHQINPDGSFRDTVVFSIINSEWKACKRSLLFKLEQYDTI